MRASQKNFAVPFCCGNGKTFFPAAGRCQFNFSGNRTFSPLGDAVVGGCAEPQEGN